MTFEDHPALLQRFRDFGAMHAISDFTYLLIYFRDFLTPTVSTKSRWHHPKRGRQIHV